MGPPAGQGWSAKHQGKAGSSMEQDLSEDVGIGAGERQRRSGQAGFALGSESAAASGQPLGVRQRC